MKKLIEQKQKANRKQLARTNRMMRTLDRSLAELERLQAALNSGGASK